MQSIFSTILLSNQIYPNILTFPKLSNYPLTFSYIHHILQFFSFFFSFPTPRGSPARRSLEAELFSPYGAEQSAAGQGNNQQLGRETIIIGLLSIIYSYIYIYLYIYLYIYICVYIYTYFLKKNPNMLCPI